MDATKTRTQATAKTTVASLLAALFLLNAGIPETVRADAATEREYQLKAAFLYNFIMFIDSPRFTSSDDEAAEEASEADKPILIGIIGKDPFGKAFEPLENREIRNRSVVVRRFEGLERLVDTTESEAERFPHRDAVRQCHVLFICASERDHLRAILRPLMGHAVLTVGDFPGFLEAGGTINFVIEDKKVRFEVNLAAAERAKLEIRSRLLRLASRVIKTDLLERQDDGGDEAQTTDK